MKKTKSLNLEKVKKYSFLIISIFFIVVAVLVLAQASYKKAQCETLVGKFVQAFDPEKKTSCENINLLTIASYILFALGLLSIIVQFILMTYSPNRRSGY